MLGGDSDRLPHSGLDVGLDVGCRAVQPHQPQMLGEELPGRPGGEQPGPSRRKRQPSMSEAMPLYTLCKEDLESMDKEVRPSVPRPDPGEDVAAVLRVSSCGSTGTSTLTWPVIPLECPPPPSAPTRAPHSVWVVADKGYSWRQAAGGQGCGHTALSVMLSVSGSSLKLTETLMSACPWSHVALTPLTSCHGPDPLGEGHTHGSVEVIGTALLSG